MNEWLKVIEDRKRYFEKDNFLLNDISKQESAATLQINESNSVKLIKCSNCNKIMNNSELIENNKVCCYCNYHYRMDSMERVMLIFDNDSVEFLDENIISSNPINFPNYDEKTEALRSKIGIKDAVITGRGRISNKDIYFGVMDYRFIMGSMGSVVGEKLTRMIELATIEEKPIIIFSASGGARMQEGMLALYQMVKVTDAISKHDQKGLLYISVLTDPTTGGVSASFASISDIIIAEPNATIGFAGKRVMKSAADGQDSCNFQTTEFHFESGHIDIVCNRKNLRNMLSDILDLYCANLTERINKLNYKPIKNQDIVNGSYESITSAWEKVKLARHPKRANFQDYINNVFDNFIELHGDRIAKDDLAIVTGVGTINGIPVTAVFSAKGKSIEENVSRNFGMANPEGYRKVVRIAKLSEKFGLPIVCFIDTPGAFCGLEAEKTGQSIAIANCIRSFIDLKTPIVSIITGEGGSGGALAMGVADWNFILENSIYSVISPEGCASILFKDSTKAKEVANYLKLTANELLKLNIVDEIISEPKGGIHTNIKSSMNYIKSKIYNKVIELLRQDIEKVLIMRSNKFRRQGSHSEI